MKIAIFTDTYLPDLNGVAASSYTLKNVLARHGHEVYVITSELPEGSEYQDQENVIRLPGVEAKAFYGYRLSSLFSFKGMREISKLGIDLIHIQTEFGMGIFGKIAGLLLNVPVVYTYHTQYEDYTHYIAGNSDTMNSIVKGLVVKMSKVYGDNCTELIVPSEKTRDLLKNYGVVKDDIHVIPTGLDLKLFDPKNETQEKIDEIRAKFNYTEDDFVCGFVGRIAPEKSVDFLIRALSHVDDERVKLLVIGEGPGIDGYTELANELGIGDRVIFSGPVDKKEIHHYYHAIDIFTCASVSETQGLTYIEALASGKAVLARHDKNLENVIQDGYNGYFFKTEEELASLISKLSHEDLAELEANALNNAYQYSDEKFYDDVFVVYQSALEHKHFTYKVKSLHEKSNHSVEVVLEVDSQKFIMTLSATVVEKFGLYKGMVLEQDVFESLVDYEKVYEAYSKALTWLTSKDYTEKQMYDKLDELELYDEVQIDMTLNALKEKNLINDEEYAINYIEKAQRMGLGKVKTMHNLRDKGISEELIEELQDNYTQKEEYDTALSLVEKSYNSNTTKSTVHFIKSMKDKLYMKGFSNDTIMDVLTNFDFSGKENQEEELILKEFDKAFNRYSNKYEGKELYNKIYLYLMRKGFDYQLIKEVMRDSGGDDGLD